jgi:hypothetical protein
MFSASCLLGQETTGQINGTTLDSSGAAITKAQVTVTNSATGFTRTATSEGTGNYSLPLLPPGTYEMRIQATGFATLAQKGITLTVGQTITLNQTLKPGGTSETVEVAAEAPLIETSSHEIGGTVSPTEVKELPILDRNFSGLMTLVPGVRQAEGFDPTKTRVGNVSINGGDGRQIDSNVDGGDNKDLVVGGLVQNFTLEGIQEFAVTTNQYTAEAGHSVGGIVNVVSKSGTNQIHGSALGLFQLSTLNRTNYFEKLNCTDPDPGRCKSVFHRYDFGGSLGGPIIKDKFFAFGAIEQQREPGSITVNNDAAQALPTFAAQTAGFAGGPYAFPTSTLPFPYLNTMATIKLDYKLSDNNMLSARYGRQKWTNPNDQLGNTNSPFNTDGSQSNSDLNNFHDLTIADNWTVSSNKVNSFTVHFQDMVNAILADPSHSFTYPIEGGGVATNPNILFSVNAQTGQNVNVPQQTLIRKYQFRDDFTWIHGNHDFKFGGNWIYFAKMGGFFFSGLGYAATFWDDPNCIQTNTCTVTGDQYNAVNAISTPGAIKEITFSGGSGSTAQPPWHSLGLYFQDNYKLTRHLTVNLGMRWDANINFLRPMLGDSLTTSNRTIWALNQTSQNSTLTNDPGLQTIQQIVGDPSALNRETTDWKEFQPRLGFAWDMRGDGKDVIRGGYGVARDQIFQNITLFSVQQTQPTIYQTTMDVTGTAGPGGACTSTPPPSSPLFNICTFRFGIDPLPAVPSSGLDLAAGSVGRIVNPKITDPWAQQFSLGWAHQLNSDYAVSVDYIHTLGTHEERVVNANPTIRTVCNTLYGGNPADPRCVGNPNARLMDAAFENAGIGAGRFAQIYEYSSNNRSFYDGVNIQLRKRMSKRYTFQASYVISSSRSWGDFPVASYGGSGIAVTADQQFAPNDEFARTNFDERNRVTVSGVFQLPGGIELAPIFQAASGKPYSLLAGTDINGDGRVTIDRACVGSTVASPILDLGCTMMKPNTLTGKAFIQMNCAPRKPSTLGSGHGLRFTPSFTTCSTGQTSATAMNRARRQLLSISLQPSALARAMQLPAAFLDSVQRPLLHCTLSLAYGLNFRNN